MKSHHLRRWYLMHKWSSLICTLFLLELCITGLPLIFHDDITDWNDAAALSTSPPDAPTLSLDTFAAKALQHYPHDRIASLFADDDEPKVYVSLVAPTPGPHSHHVLVLDAHTATAVDDTLAPLPSKARIRGLDAFMGALLTLHMALFVGLPGQLFLAFMALLFLAAIVTGVVLYGPFMKKLDFGTVRRERSTRLKWLDLHNLLGIVALGWITVVGVTGLLNTLSTPLTGLWELTTLPKLLAPYQGKPVPTPAEMVSPQSALDTVKRLMPGKTIRYVAYPGTTFGTTPQDYVFYVRGTTPATFELITPALVDARTGAFAGTVELPWYLKALELSRPLHFGNYGGLPLKILWALLDLVTIIVLVSGLYLWLARRRSQSERLAHLVALHAGTQAREEVKELRP
ncbi:PepSY-associated TM helix domain-containing protein [Rhodanobacter sp. Si-c]|uniref:PepSY-associated TM helix domain-containing protein n=1 Tax=Rhodanobacter lycopersici TaxID=3162487 RepID=A0ABV3QEP0_9GAMM